MKKLKLHNPSYELLEKGFCEWLDILGYNHMTVYNMPHIVREFLHFLDTQGVSHINLLKQIHIKNYHHYINTRPNHRRGGGLSNKYILMHMQAIEKFLEYLHHKGVNNVPTSGVKLAAPQRKEITVLTEHEIKLLFNATNQESENPKQEILNARDKATLVVYYSCGLRRNEGVQLCVDDINLDTRILHVRKGKNYKERFVPFNKTNANYLQEYIYDYRTQLLKDKVENRLFINFYGKPMTGGTLYHRLKILQYSQEDIVLREKTIGLHTLRHSIATHLLQNGMALDKISRFLGHASMDTTQIYTHLIEKEEKIL